MMVVSKAKTITIGGKQVSKIEIGGKVAWQAYKSYTYYRVYITDFMRNGTAGQKLASIVEIYIYDSSGTDFSKTSGTAYSVSSYLSGMGADKAFDRKTGTFWHSNQNTTTHWLQLKLPSAMAAASIAIVSRVSPSTCHDVINDFKFQGSNDGTTWDDLITETGQGSDWEQGATKTFTI